MNKQHPQSTRRNALPVKRINRSLLMRHEYLTRSLVQQMASGKTSSGADGVLQHAPETFNGVEVVTTMGGSERIASCDYPLIRTQPFRLKFLRSCSFLRGQWASRPWRERGT